MSILTALMLKVVLEPVLVAKKRAERRLDEASSAIGKLVGGISLWVVLAGSRFVVLTVEDVLFGDLVELGGFFAVTCLIVAHALARVGVRRLLTERHAGPWSAPLPRGPPEPSGARAESARRPTPSLGTRRQQEEPGRRAVG